jgi:hypothetical protein
VLSCYQTMLHLPPIQPQFSDHLVKSPFYTQHIPPDTSNFSLASWDRLKRSLSFEWRKRARPFSRRPRGVVDPLATTRAPAKSQGQESRSLQIKIVILNSRGLELEEPRHPLGPSRGHAQYPEQHHVQVVSMERHNKTASAAPHSSNRHHKQHARRGQTPEQYIAEKKQEAIETVMAVFNKWLNTRLAVISHVYESPGGSSGTPGAGSGGGGDGDAGSGNEKPGRASRRAKRQFHGDERNEDDSAGAGGGGRDGDGQDRGGSGNNKRARTATEEPRFACPFFQHDPNRHCTHRSCIGPGWTSIHRLK